jgi:type IV pilus assembly protein PilM
MPKFEFKIGGLEKLAGIFKKKEKYAVGVDIGSSNIKIIELEKKDGKIALRNYVIVDVDRELVLAEEKELINTETSLIIKKAMQEAGIKAKSVNSAVPSFASLVTTIEIPRMPLEEIENVVGYEAPKYIPAPLSEVIYGWQIVSGKPLDKEEQKIRKSSLGKEAGALPEKKDDEKIRILLVAVMKDISKRFEGIIKNSGLNVGYLEVDAFSLKRSLIGNDMGNYVILDIGQKITNIILVSRGNLLISRNMDIAGNKLTEVISKGLSLGYEKAVQLKMRYGLNVDEKFGTKLLEPVLRIMINEVAKEVEMFNKNYPQDKIGGVILSGGTSRLRGLRDFVQKETGIKTFYGNPWSRLEYPEKLQETLFGYGPAFAVSIGLAMLTFEE